MRTSRENFYASNKKQSQKMGGGIKALIVICVLALIYFAAAGSVGKLIANEVIAPVFEFFEGGFSSDDADEKQVFGDINKENILNENSNSAQTSGVSSEKIQLPDLTCFALQTGVYSVEEYANEDANAVKQIGGAGYIFSDDNMRVITCAFDTNEQAQSECDKILAEENKETWLYEIDAKGPKFNIEASYANIEEIKDFFEILKEGKAVYSEITHDFKNSAITKDDLYAKAGRWQEKMNGETQFLEKLSGSGDGIVAKMLELSQNVEKLWNLGEYEGDLQTQSLLEYNNVEYTVLYRNFINDLG